MMTFSLVARDPKTGMFGAITATAGPAVGALVIHGHSHTGAIATQAMTNPLYGIQGLALLKRGFNARQTLDKLLADDPERQRRQLIIVDKSGNTAHCNGIHCQEWVGSRIHDNLAVAGNFLGEPETLDSLIESFVLYQALPFPQRMLAAMQAGAKQGGDRRGLRSAALKVWNDRDYADIDVRVDWSERPLEALEEVLSEVQGASYADFFEQLPRTHSSVWRP
ncbi:DUF1028 domain-containing protein [Serratia sp. M24T3]|uniref:DUF1028 domain-containing protein n=1 Tax=Serratia sp. M24T3 TaxID=932213 RepID=UPI0002DD257E